MVQKDVKKENYEIRNFRVENSEILFVEENACNVLEEIIKTSFGSLETFKR